MQNIRKTPKSIDVKKIKKYVVFKYEDEFGFHYMVMDKLPGEALSSEKMIGPVGFYYAMRGGLPGEEPTHPETLSFKKKIKLYFGSYHSSAVFGGTANRLMCPAPNSSPWWVGGHIMETFWSGGKGPGLTEPPRN